MKKVNSIKIIITLLCVVFIFNQCSEDVQEVPEVQELSNLSGKISLTSDIPADGAIVTLSAQPNAADVIARTVSDASGIYSFMGLEEGTYYLNATFEPGNNNNLKSTGTVVLTGKEVEVIIDGDMINDVVMEGMVSDGTGSLNLAEGWKWDNTHSTIGFEFPYDAFNAIFRGHFARAGFDVLEFDEANPEATKIKAWVDVTSVETGAPSGVCGHGRDGITGCIQGTYGLELDPADTVTVICEDGSENTSFPNTDLAEYDLWGDASATTYQKQNSIVGATGVATFESKEVSAYGTGYVCTGDFTFAGATTEVSMYFSYVEGYEAEYRGADTKFSSFFGWFEFDAKNDHGIVSGHVGDAMIKVVLGVQFKKTL